MLEVNDISVSYGNVPILWNVSCEVKQGEICAIIGPNGSGKTTLLRTISGLVHPVSGQITFLNQRIDRLNPNAIVKRGIAQVPEGRGIFQNLSVMENLELGCYLREMRKNKKENLRRVFEIFPRLGERTKQAGGSMSGGEQQMLAIGRALMSSPKLVMLDEPTLGLQPSNVDKIFEIVRDLHQRGISVLLNEQRVQESLEISDRAYVLENGRVTLEGKGLELLEENHIRHAYLGTL